MKLREALITQGPSLELQRAAQAEIARLDARVSELEGQLEMVSGLLADCQDDLAAARMESMFNGDRR